MLERIKPEQACQFLMQPENRQILRDQISKTKEQLSILPCNPKKPPAVSLLTPDNGFAILEDIAQITEDFVGIKNIPRPDLYIYEPRKSRRPSLQVASNAAVLSYLDMISQVPNGLSWDSVGGGIAKVILAVLSSNIWLAWEARNYSYSLKSRALRIGLLNKENSIYIMAHEFAHHVQCCAGKVTEKAKKDELVLVEGTAYGVARNVTELYASSSGNRRFKMESLGHQTSGLIETENCLENLAQLYKLRSTSKILFSTEAVHSIGLAYVSVLEEKFGKDVYKALLWPTNSYEQACSEGLLVKIDVEI